MKIKLKEIINQADNIGKLSEMKLPIKASYRINRIISKILPDIKQYNEKRLEVIKELGIADEKNPEVYNVPKEKLPEFTKQIEELLSIEVEIDLEPISIIELGEINIEPALLVEWLFKD